MRDITRLDAHDAKVRRLAREMRGDVDKATEYHGGFSVTDVTGRQIAHIGGHTHDSRADLFMHVLGGAAQSVNQVPLEPDQWDELAGLCRSIAAAQRRARETS